MRRSVAVVALVGAVLLTATACTEEDRQSLDGAASEIAGQIGGAAGQVEEELNAGDQQPESGGEAEQPPPDEPAPEPEPAPEDTTEASDTLASLWPLLLLALIVIIVVALLVSVMRRRGRTSEQQRRLLDEALLDADWLVDTASEQPSSVDAAARARDVRVRTDRASDALRRLATMTGRRTAEAADELRLELAALSRSVIARLDDVAAGHQSSSELDIDALIERTRLARDRLIDVS